MYANMVKMLNNETMMILFLWTNSKKKVAFIQWILSAILLNRAFDVYVNRAYNRMELIPMIEWHMWDI